MFLGPYRVQLGEGLLRGHDMAPDLMGLQSNRVEKTQNHSLRFGGELSRTPNLQLPTQMGETPL